MTEDFNNINANDVLCGRGGATNNHIGNKRFRSIVASYQHEYLGCRKKEKAVIARKIVAAVKENGGRFLKRNEQSDVWVEVTHKKATEKTSQALREGLDVRHKVIRPEKMSRRDCESSGENPRKRARLVVGEVVQDTGITHSSSADSTTSDAIPDLYNEPSMFLYPVPPPMVDRAACDHVEEV